MEMNATSTSSAALLSSSAATTTTIMAERILHLPPNGEEIQQEWNFVFIAFAYILSFIASYSAVHLLDHTLWRTQEEEHVQIIKYPRIWCSIILGFGAVWSMHFVGMAAVTLHHEAQDEDDDRKHVQQCYDWPITVGSMIAAIVFIYIGLKVASNDIFAGPDRLENLKTILISNRHVTHQKHSSIAMRTIQRTVLFHNVHRHIVTGGGIAAIGAIVMHYTGMMAVHGPFQMKWNIYYLVMSVILGVVICIVGFWILFRLRWKAKQFWLRYVSAAILALAVTFLHFFGMLSVTYIADDRLENICQEYSFNTSNPWTAHQQIVVAVSLSVPLIAAIVENLINQELLLAYRIKADPDFAKLLSPPNNTNSGGSLRTSDSELQPPWQQRQKQLRRNDSSTQGKVRVTGLIDPIELVGRGRPQPLCSSSPMQMFTESEMEDVKSEMDDIKSEMEDIEEGGGRDSATQNEEEKTEEHFSEPINAPPPPPQQQEADKPSPSSKREICCTNSSCEEEQQLPCRHKYFPMVGEQVAGELSLKVEVVQ